jgi:caspase domain-containing protein
MRCFCSWAYIFAFTSALWVVLAGAPALASNGDNNTTYYGIENDADHSTSANDSATAVEEATGSTQNLPVQQSRTGQQILTDLDKLAQDHGEGGKLQSGLFVFHYSGHGSASTPDGPAVIGEPGGVIDTDQLVDKLLEIVGEDTSVLILIDSCGAGNLKNSLDKKVKDEDGKRLNYQAVMGTRKMEASDGGNSPRQGGSSIGDKVKDGLSKETDGKAKADKDKDGKVTLTEIAEYAQKEGDGFSSSYWGTDEGLKKVVTGTSLVNGKSRTDRAQNESSDPQGPANSGSGDSIHYSAETQVISFTDHFVIDTGYTNDPLEGAEIMIPQLILQGELEPGEFLFDAVDPFFRVVDSNSDLITAYLDHLLYDAERNTFEGLLRDLELSPGFSSPWADDALALTNPTSPTYLSDVAPFFTYTPDSHFLQLTGNWNVENSTSGSDGIRIAHVVPLPDSFSLLGVGLFCMFVIRRTRRFKRGPLE